MCSGSGAGARDGSPLGRTLAAVVRNAIAELIEVGRFLDAVLGTEPHGAIDDIGSAGGDAHDRDVSSDAAPFALDQEC